MEAEYQLTIEEARTQMEQLRKVFTIVRLVDANKIQCLLPELGESDASIKRDSKELKCEKQKLLSKAVCPCYYFWGKDKPCDNCISALAFRDKAEKTKLEFLDSVLYQVFSKYVEIEGVPYVIEMLKTLDMDTLIDTNESERLISQIFGMDDKVYRDVLTGAYNRRYYEEELKKSTELQGVAMIDLDDFKLYNDTFGHSAGDAALKTVVRQIRSCIRKMDSLVRYGGDEFLLMVPGIQEETFIKKLCQIQESVYSTDVPGYSKMHLSVSIGGLISEGEMLEKAVEKADKLMYQAKNQKNTVVTEKGIVDENGKVDTTKNEKVRQQILVVDDSEMNREILSDMLGHDFRILEAADGEECLKMLNQYGTGISLILLDIVMPKMDGFEVLNVMERKHLIEDIPVIMISSEDSDAYVRRAYELGVSDYISRPFDAKVVYQRVFNTIKLYAKQRRLTTLIGDQIYEKEKNNRMMVTILSHIVEFRNGESGMHVVHINRLTEKLLERLVQKTDHYQLSYSDRFLITTASALHDIGKIGIDDAILNKPGKLTKEEFEIMKTHTLIGANMLEGMAAYKEEPLVKMAYQICRWHHERYDGKGYPDGLKGDEIPISAQVVSLADVYDALVSERVYKKAFSHEKAMEMILAGECGNFNPLLLECLTDIQDTLQDDLYAGGGITQAPIKMSEE